MYKAVDMSDADSESEYSDNSKNPILGRTQLPTKRRIPVRAHKSIKNKFQGTHRRRKHICLAIAALVIMFLLVAFISINDNNNSNNNGRNKHEEGEVNAHRRSEKSIAVLNWQRGEVPRLNSIISYCPVILRNTTLLEGSQSYGAVVINSTLDNILSGRDLTNVSSNDSIIIFGTNKPLQFSNSSNISLANSHLRIYDKIFSYSLKSDFIWQPYKIVRRNDSMVMSPTLQPHWDASKANFASHVSRNFFYESVMESSPLALAILNRPCHGARKVLIERITQNMDVHTYGECGEYSCGEGICRFVPNSRGNRTYKFFLAFEEELCEDYVGESFFKALGARMLPVVFGGANYTRFAPSNSYINARDYASIRELTEYLLYLDQNPEEHIQYFIWHERYKIRPNEYELQDICEYLKNADIVQIKANTLKTTNTKTVSWLNENMCRPYELPETWTS